MNTIVKIFTGKYIDLSKIVTISEPYLLNETAHGAYFVSPPEVAFEIECQLLEQPIYCKRRLTTPEYQQYTSSRTGESKHLALINMQKEIDAIVEQWIASKEQQMER